jgi:hypothetical protein
MIRITQKPKTGKTASQYMRSYTAAAAAVVSTCVMATEAASQNAGDRHGEFVLARIRGASDGHNTHDGPTPEQLRQQAEEQARIAKELKAKVDAKKNALTPSSPGYHDIKPTAEQLKQSEEERAKRDKQHHDAKDKTQLGNNGNAHDHPGQTAEQKRQAEEDRARNNAPGRKQDLIAGRKDSQAMRDAHEAKKNSGKTELLPLDEPKERTRKDIKAPTEMKAPKEAKVTNEPKESQQKEPKEPKDPK